MPGKPMERRKFLRFSALLALIPASNVLEGLESLYAGNPERDTLFGSMEERFLGSLKHEEQVKALTELENAAVQKTNFLEEYEFVRGYVKKNIQHPSVEIIPEDKELCSRFLEATDRTIIYRDKTDVWLGKLRQGVPMWHGMRHHERLHLLQDNNSEKDKIDDLLCDHNVVSRDAPSENAEKQYLSFVEELFDSGKMNPGEVMAPLRGYKKKFNIKSDSWGAVLDDFRNRLEKQLSLTSARYPLMETHACFAGNQPLDGDRITLEGIEDNINYRVSRRVDEVSGGGFDVRRILRDIETLYGVLLKSGVKIPEAHIVVSEIVGKSLGDFDFMYYYPEMSKAVSDLSGKFKTNPEEARQTLNKIWVPYRTGIAIVVKKDAENYLARNYSTSAERRLF